MATYASATSKSEVTARMYELAGEEVEPLGPGSKEKRSALEALGKVIGLELADVSTKVECGRRISAAVDIAWGPECYSAGDTITLMGLNRLLDGVVRNAVIPGRALKASRVDWIHGSRTLTIDTGTEGGSMPAETPELERSIAEGISILSESKETPVEFAPLPSRIDAEDVTFDDGSWRTHLAAVQGWLHLSADLDTASAEDFDSSLAQGLGLGDDRRVTLDEVLPRLSDRLERALALREAFLAEMEATTEGATTHRSASANWAAAWEEAEEEEESEGSGPIHAEAATWPIREFVEYAREDELDLSPSYQRADVWPTTDSQVLIESVLRGIPLPSIIILQQTLDGRIGYEVVDGKQRLTSLLRFVGEHPRAVSLVRQKSKEWGEPDLLEIFQRDYPRFKKLWKKNEPKRLTAQLERLLYFPFPLRSGEVKPLSGELKPLRGKYYCEIRNDVISVLGEPRPVRYVFEQQSQYKLPIIVYKQVTSEQIHEVFSLYNKQGKHLNAEEIRNALYHHLALMRALLVTAGDSAEVESVAPFLGDVWNDLSSTPKVLNSYGFGQAGYKRTKLLSWVASVLILEDGRPDRRSTANHINSLLKQIADDPKHRLRDESTVKQAMLLLDKGLDAHASIPPDVWAAQFVNAQKRERWQELQLVATLIALSAAHAVHGDDLDDVLEAALDDIGRASAGWVRPEKTQTKQQWEFMARVVGDLLDILQAPAKVAHEELRSSFGHSGLLGLLEVLDD